MRRWILTLGICVLLAACGQQPPGYQSTSKQTAVSKEPTAVTPLSPKKLKASPRIIAQSSLDQQGLLLNTVQDSESPAVLRFQALNRLEKLGSKQVIPLASELALSPDIDKGNDRRMIQHNAIAILVRAEKSGNEDAKRSLNRIHAKHSSLSNYIDLLRQREK